MVYNKYDRESLTTYNGIGSIYLIGRRTIALDTLNVIIYNILFSPFN